MYCLLICTKMDGWTKSILLIAHEVEDAKEVKMTVLHAFKHHAEPAHDSKQDAYFLSACHLKKRAQAQQAKTGIRVKSLGTTEQAEPSRPRPIRARPKES